jgi:hypothetical protein
MAATGSALASDGGDPRINNPMTRMDSLIIPRSRLLHDKAVTFEEYYYYAQLTRSEERETAKTETATVGIWQVIFPTKSGSGVKPISEKSTARLQNLHNGDSSEEKPETAPPEAPPLDSERSSISEAEWTNASRAMRTASGAACFYLITTDILGPFGIG